MAAHARLTNELKEDEKCHNLMRCLICKMTSKRHSHRSQPTRSTERWSITHTAEPNGATSSKQTRPKPSSTQTQVRTMPETAPGNTDSDEKYMYYLWVPNKIQHKSPIAKVIMTIQNMKGNRICFFASTIGRLFFSMFKPWIHWHWIIHDITNSCKYLYTEQDKMTYVPSKDSDQPAHPHSFVSQPCALSG